MMCSQEGEKSEKHLDKWTVSRIWSVEKISQTHAPLLYFFLLDVSQLPPWWLIMQSCLSIAEPCERVWNPKEQLCQVNVHRKICHLRFRCRCSHFHIHSTDNGTAPPHLHRRDGVALERLARCHKVKNVITFPQLWCTRPPMKSLHQLINSVINSNKQKEWLFFNLLGYFSL